MLQHMYVANGIVFYNVRDVYSRSLHLRFLQLVFYWFGTYLSVFVILVPFVYRYCAVWQ